MKKYALLLTLLVLMWTSYLQTAQIHPIPFEYFKYIFAVAINFFTF